TQRVVLTALGGSGATPNEGLVAPVIVVSSFDELKARAAEVKGRIVLFDVPFDQHMADRGLAGPAYGQGSNFRTNGPRMAAEMGAAAALVRSD
ncbi:MAG TPA: peptidase M28, partial [Massilia sp.]|nr:peptidase M28 [Massilia sp.]